MHIAFYQLSISKSQVHNKLSAWHLGANAYLLKFRLWIFPPQLDYKDDYQEFWKLHDRKVQVLPKGINWSLGAMQEKLNIVLLQVPVHISNMNRHLGATRVDNLSQF